MKVLAVDDDPFIAELIPLIAAKVGFSDVVTATSGEEALLAIAAADRPFDCLIVDLSMPCEDGVKICASVRTIPTYHKVPIIILTEMSEGACIDRAFRAGATDYVTKPLDSVELGARMQAAHSINMAQREAESVVNVRHADQDGGRVFDLSEEISADGVGNLIDYPTLKSHLIQLTRTSLLSSQVVAIKIDQFEAILARVSSEEFLYMLSEIVDAVGEVFKTFGYLMAYAGRGTFIVVSRKASLEPSISIESDIQHLLDERNLEYDNGDPLDIDVSIGNPIRPTVTRIHRIAKTFDRAIARADSRAARKQNDPRPLSIRTVG